MIPWLLAAVAMAVPGSVRTHGSGDPVEDATVTFDGTPLVVDAQGRFTLPEGPPGLHTVAVRSDVLLSADIEVELPRKEPLVVFLKKGQGPMEIVIEAFRPSAHLTRHRVDAEMARETPGNYEDAVRLVQSLPGVAGQREFGPSAGELLVRGAPAGDSRYYLDGVEVPYLYHYNQYASVFPASQVDTLELLPSTFSPQFGDAVGAIVEAKSGLERPKGLHGDATVNFVMAGGGVKAPVGKDWWVAASGRRSYQDFVSRSAQYTFWPTFYDFSVRAENGDEKLGTGLFFWGAGDAYDRRAAELDLADPLEASITPTLKYRRGFQVGGVRHQWQKQRHGGRITAALVRDTLAASLSDDASQDQRTLTLSSRGDLYGTESEIFTWNAGWELRQEFLQLEVLNPSAAGLAVAEEAPALARGRALDEVVQRFRGDLYGEAQFLIGGKVRVMPGVRLSGDTLGQSILPNPRIAARWRAFDQTEFKIAAGRYTQRPDSSLLAAYPALPTTDSWQVGVGWEQTVASRWEFSVDAYYRGLKNPLLLRVDRDPLVGTTGHAMGVELVTRYRLREVFFFYAWLAVARSQLTVDGELYRGDADQPVSSGAVASWEIGRGWTVGLRYRISSGLPYTPVNDSLYDGGADQWIPVPMTENSARLPVYQKLDARVAKKWEFRRWALTLSTELWFVPPGASSLYPTWSYDWRNQGYVRGPVLLPLASLRVDF